MRWIEPSPQEFWGILEKNGFHYFKSKLLQWNEWKGYCSVTFMGWVHSAYIYRPPSKKLFPCFSTGIFNRIFIVFLLTMKNIFNNLKTSNFFLKELQIFLFINYNFLKLKIIKWPTKNVGILMSDVYKNVWQYLIPQLNSMQQ